MICMSVIVSLEWKVVVFIWRNVFQYVGTNSPQEYIATIFNWN